jgi:hypothetical protein
MLLCLVEYDKFRAFLSYLNSDVNKWLNVSYQTIHIWVLCQFEFEKQQVKNQVQNACTKVHITLNIWTLLNNKPILVIVSHYILADNKLESTVLALKEIEGSHKGNNIILIIIGVLKEWGIKSNLGYFVIDNTGNNDTIIRKISLGLLIYTYFLVVIANSN